MLQYLVVTIVMTVDNAMAVTVVLGVDDFMSYHAHTLALDVAMTIALLLVHTLVYCVHLAL